MLYLNKFFDDAQVIAFVTHQESDFALNDNPPFLSDHQLKVLSDMAQCSIEKVPTFKQVHSNRIVPVSFEFLSNCCLPEADGFITHAKKVPLTVRTADCLPIFIFDAQYKTIGLLHAGWKGTRQQIVKNALLNLRRRFGVHSFKLKVYLGPAIRSCCYKVGEEFLHYFPQEVKKTPDGCYFDLIAANRRQLLEDGVHPENILDCDLCTCCDNQFFSFRRQGKQSGRMLSFLMLKD